MRDSSRSMGLDSSMTMPVRPIQKPNALPAMIAMVPPDTVPADAMPPTIASAMMPSTSSRTAAPRIVTPSGVSSLPMSLSTRAVMPMLVAARMAPTNSAGTMADSPGEPEAIALNDGTNSTMPAPSANGATSPTNATSVAGPTYLT